MPSTAAPRPTVYIPNFNGGKMLSRALASLEAQTRPVEVVVVDNGSSDDSVAIARERFPRVTYMELGRNLGFGNALNRAIGDTDGDPIVLLNNDAECEPGFAAALLDGLDDGVEMVAAVLLQGDDPKLIDSAGVVADKSLMAFDYLNGRPAEEALGAAPPLGPTGGAALYRRDAFEGVGGFDEHIFLYYEDLDLALRIRAEGGRCRLAPEARALHVYSATLGSNSGAKYAHTGWSRGYLARRYGVMHSPRTTIHCLACEGAICAGQLLLNHTTRGLTARLRGWHDARRLPKLSAPSEELIDLSIVEALRKRKQRR